MKITDIITMSTEIGKDFWETIAKQHPKYMNALTTEKEYREGWVDKARILTDKEFIEIIRRSSSIR